MYAIRSYYALAYAFKWVWAPVVGHLRLPWLTRRLGRRRAWMLVAQAGVIAGLCGLAMSDPAQRLDVLLVERAQRRRRRGEDLVGAARHLPALRRRLDQLGAAVVA